MSDPTSDSMYTLGLETGWEADVITLPTGDTVVVQDGVITAVVIPGGDIVRRLPADQQRPLSDEEMDCDR